MSLRSIVPALPSFRREPLYLALRNQRSALTHSLRPPLLRSLFCLRLNEIGLRSQNRTCYPSHHHHRHLHGVLRITRYYCDLFSGYKGVYFLFHCACHYGIHRASPHTSLGTNMDPEEDVVPFPLLVNPAPLLAMEGQGGGSHQLPGAPLSIASRRSLSIASTSHFKKKNQHTPAVWSEQPNLH